MKAHAYQHVSLQLVTCLKETGVFLSFSITFKIISRILHDDTYTRDAIYWGCSL
jgi:hypothetical protein